MGLWDSCCDTPLPQCPISPPASHQPIPIVPLARFVAEVLDEPLHVRHRHAEGRPRLRHDILLDHDTAQIIRAVLESDLANILTLRDPGTLHIGNVVEVNPAQRLGPQILVCADSWRLELRVLRLKSPRDESSESTK